MPDWTHVPAKYRSPNRDNVEYGPAMKVLNERQRALVEYILDTGTDNWTDAVQQAGYGGDYDTQRVTASRLRRSPKIAAAIVELGRMRPNFDLPMALKTIRTIAADPSHKDAGKMALALAGMSGISPVVRHEQQVQVTHSVDPMLALEQKLALLPPEIARQLRETLLPPDRRMIDVTPVAVHGSDDLAGDGDLSDTEDLSVEDMLRGIL